MKAIIIALLLMFLTACATPMQRAPTCVAKSVMCALTFASRPIVSRGEKLILGKAHPVRLVTGPTDDARIGHMQAQAYLGGEWRWLTFDGVHCITVEKCDYWFVPKEVWDLGNDVEIVLGNLEKKL
jgi:hypothetical protein